MSLASPSSLLAINFAWAFVFAGCLSFVVWKEHSLLTRVSELIDTDVRHGNIISEREGETKKMAVL